jgi:hypothetical protein
MRSVASAALKLRVAVEMPNRTNAGVGRPSCPRCGAQAFDTVADWPGRPPTRSFGGGEQRAPCANCGLVGALWWSIGEEGFSRALTQSDAHVRLLPSDLRVEPLGENEATVRITHATSGIVVEASAYATWRDNYLAALQTLALQLRDRDEQTFNDNQVEQLRGHSRAH